MRSGTGALICTRESACLDRLMADYTQMRLRLLELHNALLEAERVNYERLHGRVSSNAFLQALTHDPSLTWLAPLSLGIVRLDELLDLGESSDEPAALGEHVALLQGLLRLGEAKDAFALRYAELVQRVPEVAFAHAALASVLG
jgi:hypothetical protein